MEEDADERSLEEQVEDYRAYLEREPNDHRIWFDLGLRYKWLRRWKECAAANERALSIHEDPEDPAWWNLGIAATALRKWNLARKAWRGYGLEIGGVAGPIACKYGQGPVRLPHGEVVWGERIDPARLIVRNIPLPGSGFRWGDVVLHDGAPNGERISNGRTYPVFDVLEKWSPSEIPTYEVDVTCASDGDSDALVELFEEHRFAAEDWSANVRSLCRACSTGNPDARHDHSFGTEESQRRFGIAAPKGLAERLLRQWAQAGAEREHGALELVS